MADTDNSTLATFLKNHPRMLGALITMMLVLTQAGTVMAEGTGGSAGP